jgi:hypothetical protein
MITKTSSFIRAFFIGMTFLMMASLPRSVEASGFKLRHQADSNAVNEALSDREGLEAFCEVGNECDPNAICKNLDFGYSCSCNMGFVDVSPDGTKEGSLCKPVAFDCNEDRTILSIGAHDYASIDLAIEICGDGKDGCTYSDDGPYAIPEGWELAVYNEEIAEVVMHLGFGTVGVVVADPASYPPPDGEAMVTGIELCSFHAKGCSCETSGSFDYVYSERTDEKLGTLNSGFQTEGCDEVLLIRRTRASTYSHASVE